MDHLRILRRAFDITRVYRALWLFGVFLALTTTRTPDNPARYTLDENDFRWPNNNGPRPWNWNWNWNGPDITGPWVSNIIAIIIGVLIVLLVLGVIFAILRYVSNTALIRMVSGYESTGNRVTVGEGFRLGWSRASFRSWLIDLFFALAGFVVIILSLALVATPLLLWTTGSDTAGAVGTAMAIGLFILWILLVIAAAAVLSIVLELAYRAVVLEGLGVFDGIRRGWRLFRSRLGDTIVMALILFGIGLVFSILMIPVVVVLLLGGVLIGGIPALLAGGITNIFAHGATPQIVAAAIGVPILLAVLIIPLLILGGLFEAFKSSAWTLTFRELLALESVKATPTAPSAPSGEPPAEA